MRGSGFVLMALSPQRMHLGEFLADSGLDGLDVVEGHWGLPAQIPTVIVTDNLPSLTVHPALARAITQGLSGTVVVGENSDQAAVEQSAKAAIEPDACVPSDTSGRELATVVRLVAKITTLRRQQSRHFDECQHWIELAMHDVLTGLPNRRHWETALEKALLECHPLNVAMIDVDFFKRINDADGHSIGDRVLHEAAIAMRSQLRRSDFVARLGGDEFGLLIPFVSSDEAEAILERLRQHVSEHLVSVHLPAATLSAGLVHVAVVDDRTKEPVMEGASRSLRYAKQRQKNCTVSATSR